MTQHPPADDREDQRNAIRDEPSEAVRHEFRNIDGVSIESTDESSTADASTAGKTDLTRRAVLRTGALTVGLGSVGSASALGTEATTDTVGDLANTLDTDDELEARQIPPSDLTGVVSQLDTVSPANASLPERASGISPGSQLFITRADSSGTAGCTANFVWQGADGTLYLGAAGHCFLPSGAAADQNAGGSYDSSQVTTKVCIDCTFGGATALNGLRGTVVELGGVAYARQSQDGDEVGNDFGLVAIPASAEDLVNPAMPTFGGPTEEGFVNAGEDICHYGNGVVFGETFVTKPRTGVGISNSKNDGQWLAELAASPGDSGSAVQGCRPTLTGIQGVEAAGILTHIVTGLSSGVAGTNVAKAERMATQASLDIEPMLV